MSPASVSLPDRPEAWNEQGTALASAGKFDRALVSFQRAAALGPEMPEPACNLGQTLLFLGRPAEGLPWLERAVSLRPSLAIGHALRADALSALRRYEEAVESFDRALSLEPDHVDALCGRGIALLRLGRYDHARASVERALTLQPGHLGALNTRGNALAAVGRLEEAFASFAAALARWPDFPEALISYGSWLARIGRSSEASGMLRRAAELVPDYPELAGAAFDSAARCCDWADYAARVGVICGKIAAGHRVAAPFHMLLISGSAAEQLCCARSFARERLPAAGLAPLPAAAYPEGGRLKIAYLSPDFRGHPVARQACGLFERHDRSRFEIIAIALGRRAQGDSMRTRLEHSFDRFIEVPDSVTDLEVARQLRQMEISIAVDLAGYTTDARPGILAHRPAPVQISFLGYPGTLGASHIDYLVADRIVVPPDHRACYCERIIEMPHSFFVTDDQRVSAPPPSRSAAGLPEHAFVYCCFNHPYKITPTTFDAWMRILSAAPQAILWLTACGPVVSDNLRREAAARGVDPDRLIFAPRLPNAADYLGRLALADLFLDTLPYNAHATACDALWAGVPVLTRRGGTFAGRVAASLLHAAGFSELVVDSDEAYIALACELARDPALLADLRGRLSTLGRRSPLFDTDRFRKQLEWAYLAAWDRCLRAQAPSDLVVPAL